MRRTLLHLAGTTLGLLVGWVVWASLSQRSYDWSGAAPVALLAAGTVLVLRRLGRSRDLPPPAPAGRPAAALPQFRDLLLIRERVRWGGQSADRFAQVVVPLLRELADDRLARRRGLDRTRDRAAVTALLGTDLLWLLEGPPPPVVPRPEWLDDALGRIERL